MNKYRLIIGLEVHVELATKRKMFCNCDANYFGQSPNTHTCPVCLGLPGALPYPNEHAIEWCIMIGLALNCTIPLVSKFDRKNYFYPDLPKGYQISQYDEPFALNGYIEVEKEKGSTELKKIRIRRVHMEEDTGKLTHATTNGKNVSLIDYNRSSVPLVEIVTEPDFENAYQVTQYLQKLQQIVRYLGVSNADMEKGDMRLEPNISLQDINNPKLPAYKVEVKNINSFKFVADAIEYEVKRQAKILDDGGIPVQETRGWHEGKNQTVSQRIKEEANDYRYFPEPDIPPITFNPDYIDGLRQEMPELPQEKLQRFQENYSLSHYDAEILTRNRALAEFYEQAVIDGIGKVTTKEIANVIINKKVDYEKLVPADLIKMLIDGKKKDEIDPSELITIISEVLSANQKAVEEYKAGKETVLMFLLGQVMRKAARKLDTTIVKNEIIKHISK